MIDLYFVQSVNISSEKCLKLLDENGDPFDVLVHSLSDSVGILAVLLNGCSFADVVRIVTAARRSAIVSGTTTTAAIERVVSDLSGKADRETRLRVAAWLSNTGKSQRDVAILTGLSRDTLRKHLGPTAPSKLNPNKRSKSEPR